MEDTAQVLQSPPVQAAREVITTLVGAIKNFSLYPNNHAFARKQLALIHGQLHDYLQRYGRLHIDVDKHNLLFGDTVVYEGPMLDFNPAAYLSRDGIVWIEFLPGLTMDETRQFLEIIHKNRLPSQSLDSDIVIDFWEANFSHILYEKTDILFQDTPAFQFSVFKVTPGVSDSSGPASPVKCKNKQRPAAGDIDTAAAADVRHHLETRPQALPEEPPVSLALTAPGDDLWNLTETEKAQLVDMVFEAEHQDQTEDVIDVLLISLALQKLRQNVVDILEFLKQQYVVSLRSGRFDCCLRICRNTKAIAKDKAKRYRWMQTETRSFFQTLAQPECCRFLEPFFQDEATLVHHPHLEQLWLVLQALPAPILPSLTSLAHRVRHPGLRSSLIRIILIQGRKDPIRLAAQIPRLETDIQERIFELTIDLPQKAGDTILIQLALHAGGSLGRQALERLLPLDRDQTLALFPLIESDDHVLRHTILKALDHTNDPRLESRLLEHLKHLEQGEEDHIRTCYQALGRCGTQHAHEFLKKILLQKNLSSMLRRGRVIHKEGAALALKLMGDKNALAILRQGAASLVPDTHIACTRALQDTS